ncbi:glycosyltransferase [Candidatus Parcubacteria bacterium]|nr:glycosyltransferase [Candidatus Parcubacteria bacterium]
MKIALVHEYLNQFGGAERMLQVLCDLFPHAPIYTLIYDEKATRGLFKNRTIKTSFLQKFPFSKSHHQLFPVLMPLAVEQFDFSEFDIVISISASFAKGIITKPSTRHVSYYLTPPRFLWDGSQKFIEEFGYPALMKKVIPVFISYLRIWDHDAASRADEFWSISDFVNKRVKKYYNQDSTVIYPPVQLDQFQVSNTIGQYFFMVGRLVSYKKFNIAVKAFTKLGLPLKIAGVGPELKNLKKIAGPNIEFLGMVSDQELATLYSQAQALIFPQEEDFGIVPLESMASGRPVIAYRGGGAIETIVNGVTGIFFDQQHELSLIEAVQKFNQKDFDSTACRKQAELFSVETFKQNILQVLAK